MNMRSGKWEALIVSTILAVTLEGATADAQDPDGAALYRQQCKMCHGVKGVTPQRMLTLYPELKTLADSGAFAKLPKDSLVAVMRHGKGTHMKSFASVLSAEQMEAIAKFIKSL
jgi:cytochrome c oxidase cbb3-type subunit III